MKNKKVGLVEKFLSLSQNGLGFRVNGSKTSTWDAQILEKTFFLLDSSHHFNKRTESNIS